MKNAQARRLKNIDPDTCVDFTIRSSGHVTNKYRENYDKIFRKKKKKNG